MLFKHVKNRIEGHPNIYPKLDLCPDLVTVKMGGKEEGVMFG